MNGQHDRKVQKITTFGQAILDTICNHVEMAGKRGRTGCHGHIGWSIGKTGTVVAQVAKVLGRSVKSVAGGLSDLIEKGYLSTDLQDDDSWKLCHDELTITHEGWMAYSEWSVKTMQTDMGMEFDSTEDYRGWIEWDGVDGTAIPYANKPAFD